MAREKGHRRQAAKQARNPCSRLQKARCNHTGPCGGLIFRSADRLRQSGSIFSISAKKRKISGGMGRRRNGPGGAHEFPRNEKFLGKKMNVWLSHSIAMTNPPGRLPDFIIIGATKLARRVWISTCPFIPRFTWRGRKNPGFLSTRRSLWGGGIEGWIGIAACSGAKRESVARRARPTQTGLPSRWSLSGCTRWCLMPKFSSSCGSVLRGCRISLTTFPLQTPRFPVPHVSEQTWSKDSSPSRNPDAGAKTATRCFLPPPEWIELGFRG